MMYIMAPSAVVVVVVWSYMFDIMPGKFRVKPREFRVKPRALLIIYHWDGQTVRDKSSLASEVPFFCSNISTMLIS
jgi:hypothetical protein